MVYTTAERIEIVRLYFRNNDCARATARVFNEMHPDKFVGHQYVLKLMQKFMETGSVANKKHQPERRIINEPVEIAVLGHVAMDNNQSLNKLSRASGVSTSSIWRIKKKHKFHPYKIKLLQELNEDDNDRRLQFCEVMSNNLLNTMHLYNICFSDECMFFLNGQVNRHNCRYWSDTNPHWFRETHTQYPQRLNVWAGIVGDHIVGPYFIDGNLTSATYLELLDTTIDPRITELLENDENLLENELVFQQDGAPPHYALPVREYLNDRFPGRWIGRRGPIEWPARSPDLSPLDYFLWGHLKSKVYATQPADIEDLRQRIIEECRQVTPQVLANVRELFESRLYYCMEMNGGHFEHLL